MKKTLFLIVVIIPLFSFSQNKFEIAIKPQVNYYTFLNTNYYESPNYSGWYAYGTGLDFKFAISKNIKIGTGLNYSIKKLRLHDEPLPYADLVYYTANIDMKYKFIELPLFVEFNFFTEKRISPFISLGGMYQKLFVIQGHVANTNPPGDENDLYSIFFTGKIKGEALPFKRMLTGYTELGLKYNLKNRFYFGLSATYILSSFAQNSEQYYFTTYNLNLIFGIKLSRKAKEIN